MQIEQGNNLVRAKVINQSAILRMIYYYGPIKRAEIARRLELTLPTITINVNNMLAQGIVREVSARETDSVALGRKAHFLEIVPEARHFIGVEITGSRRCISIVDYCGNELHSYHDTLVCADYGKNMEKTADIIAQCLKKCRLAWEDISGICIALPGVVDREEGILKVHPRNQWNDKNICEDFRTLTGYRGSITVENNACVRALGTQLYQRRKLTGIRSFTYLFVDTGIACPLIVSDANYTGSVVGAGEVGHMVMEPDGRKCSCGNHGCLEAYASDYAVISKCREAMAQGRAALLKKICAHRDMPDMAEIVEAQRAEDGDVASIIESAIEMLGVAAANIINFTSPDSMLVDCKLFGEEKNCELFKNTAKKNLCNKTYRGTQLIFVEPDKVSGAKGAAAVAINHELEM